jgi:aminoglycoside phosphotransferase (APT) family kinase protein
MNREHTVITALGKTSIPVPSTFGLCVDESVNGAPFYVMSFVEGLIIRDDAAASALTKSVRHQASMSLIDTLAQLHAVDIDAIGLGEFGRRDGYITRQLKRWHGQFTQSTANGLPGPAIVDRVHELLTATIPEQQGTGIVHGDYRLDNTILDDQGNVRAILDWEICTLGDPLADLGLLLVYWTDPGDPDVALLGVAPTTLPGFADRAELLARYATQSGRDVSSISYYKAFGLWKLACILQGVHARYAGGAAAGDRSNVDQFAAHVERLGQRALAEVESL